MGFEEGLNNIPSLKLEKICIREGKEPIQGLTGNCRTCIADEKNKQCPGYREIVMERAQQSNPVKFSQLYPY